MDSVINHNEITPTEHMAGMTECYIEPLVFKFEKKTGFTVKQKYSAFGQDKPFVSRLRREGLVLGNRCILLVGRVRISIFISVAVISRKWHAKLSENK